MIQVAHRPYVSLVALAIVVAAALLPAKADTVSAGLDVTEGDRLAHALCINCHVVDVSGPVIRTDRVPSFSWIANQDGVTAERIKGWLITSHERMPDFSLSREEIRKLSAYILSLRK